MLKSAEHEILNAHKYKHMKKFSFSSGSDKAIVLFFLLINVKMPTTVSGKNSCSDELSMKFFITSELGYQLESDL